MTTPHKPPFQFGLASLLIFTAAAAFFAWLGREYWLIFGPREGMLWLGFVAGGATASYSLARWVIYPILNRKNR